MPNNENTKNPCIRKCGYDDNNTCFSCGRTKYEVSYWGDFSDEEKIEILKRIKITNNSKK